MSAAVPNRCTATSKRTGKQCRQFTAPGATVCRFHGGAARQVIAAADRRVKRAELERTVAEYLEQIGAEPVGDLLDGLMEAVTHCARMVRVHELLVADRSPLGVNRFGEQVADPAAVEYRHWLDTWARLTKAALDAGIDERRLQLSELDVGRLFDAVAGALSDAALTVEQSGVFRRSLAGRLRALGSVTDVA